MEQVNFFYGTSTRARTDKYPKTPFMLQPANCQRKILELSAWTPHSLTMYLAMRNYISRSCMVLACLGNIGGKLAEAMNFAINKV